MTARQRGAALVTCLTVAVVASGCSLLPDAGPKGPSGIDLTRGDYAVVYADSITREAGVATISADGALLQISEHVCPGSGELGGDRRCDSADR